MALVNKRIIDLPERSALNNDDYTVVDGDTGGTAKYNLANMNDSIDEVRQSVTTLSGTVTAQGQQLATTNQNVAQNTEDITDLKEDLGDMSTNGIVPTSRQLLSDKYAVDEEPYKYRASYSGDRMDDEIVGGSIVWNQLVNSASVTLQSGHKYISKIGTAWTVETSTGTAITGLTSGSDMITDLTTMFGTEVADYIYNLEQAEAGAGVAWFKNLFPNDYYEYSEPTLKHVEGLQKHEMVGFNQWDEEWESGIYNPNTGLPMSDSNYIRSKNKIELLSGASYYVKKPTSAGFRVLYYDASDSFISNEVIADSWPGKSISIPSNARYIRFYCGNKTYSHDICINLSDPSRNGEYEPYVKHSYPLDSTLTLRGIPKIDASGNLYYDGDTYESDGTVTRKYGIVDLGTLSWSYVGNAGAERFFAQSFTIKPPSATSIIGNVICPKYIAIAQSRYTQFIDDKIVCVQASGLLIVRDTAYTDAAAFKASLSGVMLVYELATPTTETAQPYQNLQIVDASGTEEYVSTSIVPVGHYTKYYDDLRKKLDGLPWDLSMIAPIETGTTASQAYVVGKYFILDNQLCKAKTAIASGATFTLNTNYEVTTVADELYTALHA